MILGLGCDIVQVSRFSKNEAFLLRFIKNTLRSGKLQNLKFAQQDRTCRGWYWLLPPGLRLKKPYQKLWEADFGKG